MKEPAKCETPDELDPAVRQLISDPSAPWGRDGEGIALIKEQYESLFNVKGPNGELWQNYPLNDGAVPGTKVSYHSMDPFIRDYGVPADGVVPVDRLGKIDGDYLGVMSDGVPAPFEDRSLPIYNLTQPYREYVLTGSLPEGWTIEVSEVAPAFARDGGGIQILVRDADGTSVTVSGMREAGILR
jgi:hypothetical protein